MNWGALLRRETKPPWKPGAQNMSTSSKNSNDVSNFEQTFTNLPVQSLGSSLNGSLGRSVRGKGLMVRLRLFHIRRQILCINAKDFQDRLNLVVVQNEKHESVARRCPNQSQARRKGT